MKFSASHDLFAFYLLFICFCFQKSLYLQSFRIKYDLCSRERGLMDKRNADILYFVAFCIEQYKMHKGLSGSEIIKLFDQNGVTDYLASHFDILHTQGSQWLMQEIDDYIKNKQR